MSGLARWPVTLLITARLASTAVRGHFVGLAAAVGKAGAAIGTQVFSAVQVSCPPTPPLSSCACR